MCVLLESLQGASRIVIDHVKRHTIKQFRNIFLYKFTEIEISLKMAQKILNHIKQFAPFLDRIMEPSGCFRLFQYEIQCFLFTSNVLKIRLIYTVFTSKASNKKAYWKR